MADKIIKTDQGYEIHYSGGRLADVVIDGIAVECIQVRDYDFRTGEFGRMPSDAQILKRVAAGLDPEDMPNYRELAQFYAR